MARKRTQDGLYRRPDSPFIWASYTDAGGQRVRCSTGTQDAHEAQVILADWRLAAYRQRTWGEEPPRTFEELMVRYLQETQAEKRSAARDRTSARALRAHFAGRVLNLLKAADVRAYISARRAAGRADSTIRRELALLSAALNHARSEWDWALPNPVEKHMPPPGPGRIRWLTKAEAARLLAAARASTHAAHLADFIELGLHTGARSQELLGLEWARVDLEQGLLYLPAAKHKSKRDASIPLNADALALLRRRAAAHARDCPDSPWVFYDPRRGGARIGSIRRGFRTACRRAGITDFRPHDLRHTCATWLVQAGVPLAEIRDLLRHSSIQVTEKYAHLAPEAVRATVRVLERATTHASRLRHVGRARGRGRGRKEEASD